MTDLLTAAEALSPRRSRQTLWWFGAALLWLGVVVVVAVHQWQFWHQDRIDADVLALLPTDEQAPDVELATRKLADAAAGEIVIMLGAASWQDARRAVAVWRSALHETGVPMLEQGAPDAATMNAALAFYLPWRGGLLTAEQRHALQTTDAAGQLETALAALYQPGVQARLSSWVADPLALLPEWWSARASASKARLRDGLLWVSTPETQWVVLRYRIAGSAFRLDGNALYDDALRQAQSAVARTLPDTRILQAGVPLHAEAAAVQAEREINTIGWGSLAAVLLLAWLAFRGSRPIVLVGLSLLIGCAVALSVTAWVFGKVHLITLIFGASLVGVAEDYGIHYFASRQAYPNIRPRAQMLHLLPSLSLAVITSVAAYLALGIAAFPGLRQMALFSAVGLLAAMLTVVCWFPLLDRKNITSTDFSRWLGNSLEYWPRMRTAKRAWVICAAIACLSFVGMLMLDVRDDVRQLQNSPPELVRQQQHIGQLLGLPSPAQFYIVRGDDAEQLLRREEALKTELDSIVATGGLAGYSALSDWVPSIHRQTADAELSGRVETELLAGINTALGEELRRPASSAAPLTLETWLQHPVSETARVLWLGVLEDGRLASVLMLRGLHDTALLPQLASVAQAVDGVRWVDKPAEISALLARYRVTMTSLLALGHVVVFAVLFLRYRAQAWRIWLPTALATALTLAIFGISGQRLQLFNVLAFTLLLGVGIDYGIFLLEHRDDHSAWLAVVLGASSTWMAFGLLALSSTPALRSFGLTLMVGLVLVGFLAPAMRASAADVPAPYARKTDPFR